MGPRGATPSASPWLRQNAASEMDSHGAEGASHAVRGAIVGRRPHCSRVHPSRDNVSAQVLVVTRERLEGGHIGGLSTFTRCLAREGGARARKRVN